jgi:NAD(P)-dependent dehydrogenase (short-subunit alcohol dehydrogenase family)
MCPIILCHTGPNCKLARRCHALVSIRVEWRLAAHAAAVISLLPCGKAWAVGPKNASKPSMAERPVVVITGASAGVGRATVRAFTRWGGQRGIRIALLARGREGLAATQREVEAAGGEALALPTDVADAAQVEAAAANIEQRFGPPGVWVNNAMTSVFSPVREMEAAEYRRVTDVTYLGVVYGTLAALRLMLPRDRGVIVQVGSALAYRSIPLQSAYCGAKHAIVGFTASLRTELLHDHSRVRVTMVHMPALNTPQFDWVKSKLPRRAQPVPPIFQPEVAAEAILYASQHHRRQIWVGRTTVEAIAGNRVAPGFLDHRLAQSGYESQQTDQPEDPNRPDNLWQPVEGDRGAHGRFDDRAEVVSPELWLAKHRPHGRQWLVVAGAAGVAGTAAVLGWRARKAA